MAYEYLEEGAINSKGLECSLTHVFKKGVQKYELYDDSVKESAFQQTLAISKSSLEVSYLDPLMGGAMGRLQIEMSEPGKKYFYFMHNWQRKFESFKMAND